MRSLILLLTIGTLFSGCSKRPPDEALIKEAFYALKEKDWEAYSRLTITTADFALKEKKIGIFQESQSYTGGVFKPQEIERQKLSFEKAITGGEKIINFNQAEFVSLGLVKESGNIPTLTGEDIPVTAYSIKIRDGNVEVDTKDLDPIFILTKWGNQYRILKLGFREASHEETLKESKE
jgi:hypothetical protein